MNFNLGFSIFRIMAGITMLVGGYDKTINIIKINFNPDNFGTLQYFLSSFYGAESKITPQSQLLFPKFAIYILTYLMPFWELAIGVFLVLGLFRKLGSYLGMLLMLCFLAGTQGAMLGSLHNIDMYIIGISYYFLQL